MELVKKRTGIEAKFYDLCVDVVKEQGFALYDVEYIAGSCTLRVYIMNEETKTAVIENCIQVDRAMSPHFDEETGKSWIPKDIVLEVSSPGVFRSLKTREHFMLAQGEIIKCVIQGNLSPEIVEAAPKALKKAKSFRGKLVQITDENILLNVSDFEFSLDFEQIKKASLDPDF